MFVFATIVQVILLAASFTMGRSAPPLENNVLSFLQQEQVACTLAQQSILQKLRSHNIAIGSEPNSLRKLKRKQSSISDKIAISTKENPVECRISLDKAPIGAKCVAPCGCTGSQKWVQFSILNKLRRKDPQQWITCRTCQQPFRFDLFTAYAPLQASLIGYVLDHRAVLRGGLAAAVVLVLSLIQFPVFFSAFLVSKTFWQMYPNWSQLVRLPLALKIWLLQLSFRMFVDKYLEFEKNVIVNYLADMETTLIEENLPSGTQEEIENIQ